MIVVDAQYRNFRRHSNVQLPARIKHLLSLKVVVAHDRNRVRKPGNPLHDPPYCCYGIVGLVITSRRVVFENGAARGF